MATGAVTALAGSSVARSGVGETGFFSFSGSGSELFIGTEGAFLKVSMLGPDFESAPIVIPASTFALDIARTCGDRTLPEGKVTFVVGAKRLRIEHISKNILCVRSDYFNAMFRAGMPYGMQESADTEIEVRTLHQNTTNCILFGVCSFFVPHISKYYIHKYYNME